jgi:hypothetical protein
MWQSIECGFYRKICALTGIKKTVILLLCFANFILPETILQTSKHKNDDRNP